MHLANIFLPSTESRVYRSIKTDLEIHSGCSTDIQLPVNKYWRDSWNSYTGEEKNKFNSTSKSERVTDALAPALIPLQWTRASETFALTMCVQP